MRDNFLLTATLTIFCFVWLFFVGKFQKSLIVISTDCHLKMTVFFLNHSNLFITTSNTLGFSSLFPFLLLLAIRTVVGTLPSRSSSPLFLDLFSDLFYNLLYYRSSLLLKGLKYSFTSRV